MTNGRYFKATPHGPWKDIASTTADDPDKTKSIKTINCNGIANILAYSRMIHQRSTPLAHQKYYDTPRLWLLME